MFTLCNPETKALTQEDLQRGYWDDFKQLKEQGGKMFRAPDGLTAAEVAPEFPNFQACAALYSSVSRLFTVKGKGFEAFGRHD